MASLRTRRTSLSLSFAASGAQSQDIRVDLVCKRLCRGRSRLPPALVEAVCLMPDMGDSQPGEAQRPQRRRRLTFALLFSIFALCLAAPSSNSPFRRT